MLIRSIFYNLNIFCHVQKDITKSPQGCTYHLIEFIFQKCLVYPGRIGGRNFLLIVFPSSFAIRNMFTDQLFEI